MALAAAGCAACTRPDPDPDPSALPGSFTAPPGFGLGSQRPASSASPVNSGSAEAEVEPPTAAFAAPTVPLALADAGARAVRAVVSYSKGANAPSIGGGAAVGRYCIGDRTAFLLTRVESAGSLIAYAHALAVFARSPDVPEVLVVSEAKNTTLGSGSHFLTLTEGPKAKRRNLGSADDWATLSPFAGEALAQAASALGITNAPEDVTGANSTCAGRTVTRTAPWTRIPQTMPIEPAELGSATVIARRRGRRVTEMQLAGDSLVWLDCPRTSYDCKDGALVRVAPSGGKPVVIAAGLDEPSDLAAHGSHLYWIEAGVVKRAPATGGAAEVVARTKSPPAKLCADAAGLVWLERGDADSVVMSVSYDGGAPKALLSVLGYASAIRLEGSEIYVVGDSFGDAAILVAPRSGGPAKRVAIAKPAPTAMALDSDGIYWATGLSGKVLRAPRHEAVEPVELATLEFSERLTGGPLIVSGGRIYFGTASAVVEMATTGGAPRSVVLAPKRRPNAAMPLAYGDGQLYFIVDELVARVAAAATTPR